jgi:hypothetical protein
VSKFRLLCISTIQISFLTYKTLFTPVNPNLNALWTLNRLNNLSPSTTCFWGVSSAGYISVILMMKNDHHWIKWSSYYISGQHSVEKNRKADLTRKVSYEKIKRKKRILEIIKGVKHSQMPVLAILSILCFILIWHTSWWKLLVNCSNWKE